MFCVKTLTKTYEMSAPDTKQRQEWTTGQRSYSLLYTTHTHCVGNHRHINNNNNKLHLQT